MNAIGGYFELEFRQGNHYHKNAINLNTARNCLEYILKSEGYKKIHIPYYTCSVIMEPIKKSNIEYEFYHIDINLAPVIEYKLEKDEAFLYTNYFGLKQSEVLRLSKIYKRQLIVDNSQAFYALPITGIDSFYSTRKFFGVPDGAYLYTNKYLNETFEQDVSFERMEHLLKRIDLGAEEGFEDFQINDKSLKNQPIKKMSNLTDKIMKSIDYEFIKLRRINNYKFIDAQLNTTNILRLELTDDDVPMVYPYLTNDQNLKNKLIRNKIFVPTYWKNVMEWCKTDSFECMLTEKMLPLPIDQRYNSKDLKKILKQLELWI